MKGELSYVSKSISESQDECSECLIWLHFILIKSTLDVLLTKSNFATTYQLTLIRVLVDC